LSRHRLRHLHELLHWLRHLLLRPPSKCHLRKLALHTHVRRWTLRVLADLKERWRSFTLTRLLLGRCWLGRRLEATRGRLRDHSPDERREEGHEAQGRHDGGARMASRSACWHCR